MRFYTRDTIQYLHCHNSYERLLIFKIKMLTTIMNKKSEVV